MQAVCNSDRTWQTCSSLICWKTGLTVGGIKRATWLFNSILCNSAKQVARFPTALRQPSVHYSLTTDERDTWVFVARALLVGWQDKLARRYLKIYVTEINKNRLNTCVVACAYHVYHSVAKRLSSNLVPRAFPSKKCEKCTWFECQCI